MRGILTKEHRAQVEEARRRIYDAKQLLPKAKAIGCDVGEIEQLIGEIDGTLESIVKEFFTRGN